MARARSALVGQHTTGYDFQAGAEVGGPILRNRLFFWAGIAPRREAGSFVRDVQAQIDADGDGVSDVDGGGDPLTQLVQSNRSGEWRQSYAYGGKLTWLPRPEQRLNLGIFGTPTTSRVAFDRTLGDAEAAADLRWPMQTLTKNNTDIIASWTGQFFDRRWKVEATAGLHDERYGEKAADPDMSALNQVEWHGTSLFEREGIEACRPQAARALATWDPCPVDLYRTGGFGHLRSYSAQRWSTDLKSTHLFSPGGTHEVKYGARLELSTSSTRPATTAARRGAGRWCRTTPATRRSGRSSACRAAVTPSSSPTAPPATSTRPATARPPSWRRRCTRTSSRPGSRTSAPPSSCRTATRCCPT